MLLRAVTADDRSHPGLAAVGSPSGVVVLAHTSPSTSNGNSAAPFRSSSCRGGSNRRAHLRWIIRRRADRFPGGSRTHRRGAMSAVAGRSSGGGEAVPVSAEASGGATGEGSAPGAASDREHSAAFKSFLRGPVDDDSFDPPRWSRLAIASLIPGVTGFLWPAGVLLGIVALVRIRRTGRKGRWLAVAGLVMCLVWAVGGTSVLGPFAGKSDSKGAGTVGVFDLKAGDCMARLPQQIRTVSEVAVVPCSQPHQGEVFASADLGAAFFGNESDVTERADKVCTSLIEGYAMDSWAIPDSVSLGYFYPRGHSLANVKHRNATCFFRDGGAGWTGTLRRDATNLTAAQLRYLKAAKPADDAWDAQPELTAAENPAINREWAGTLAKGIEAEIELLDEPGWPDAARPAVTALVSELRSAVPHLTAARQSRDNRTLQQELALADEHTGHRQAMQARAALGLASEQGRPTATGGA
ncbi:DUF4190 domain-containing protein [Streptomyces sp. NPDC092296]|uniref:DUF4190 domain-containing protein n=1 Tax=Streptomyces sp. NPDC092296 TaxID=3366012 RepID=UPI0037F9D3A6